MQDQDKSKQNINNIRVILALAVLEGVISILVTVLIPSDPKNAILLGFSLSRIAILFFSLVLLTILIILLIKPNPLKKLFEKFSKSKTLSYCVNYLVILSLFFLWVSIWIPVTYLGRFEASFVRIKPLIIWIVLILLQISLYYKISTRSFSNISKKSLFPKKPFFFFFICLIGLWAFITISKIGLVKDTAYWNAPGVPISGIQFFALLLFVILFHFVKYWPSRKTHSSLKQIMQILIPVTIYLATILIWGSTPMLKHYFSLEPTAPNFQPFPFSDARFHDIGAISILKGQGIFFKGYTDKPLYMVFLALLHLIAKNDYGILTWLQIGVLAGIPVLVYVFGKRFHSQLFGLLLSIILIFQQRNAIALSYKIASVNPKLFVTEVIMLFGMIFIAYLSFLWIKTREKKLSLILGGTLGALSLIRINPVFMIPLLGLVGLFLFRKNFKLLSKQILLLLVGFVLVFSPWLISGVNSEGESWFMIKIRDVLNTRYSQEDQSRLLDYSSQFPLMAALNEVRSIPESQTRMHHGQLKIIEKVNQDKDKAVIQVDTSNAVQILGLIGNHYLHNIATSLLILPDSLEILNASDDSLKAYRVEETNWDGNLTPVQHIFILFNLFIIVVGLTESWVRHRWAGLMPVFVFLMYNFSLSFAMSSGSRYIVPINWVFFFYFAIGLIHLKKRLFAILQLIPKVDPLIHEKDEFSSPRLDKISLGWIFVLLLLLALVVPFANLVLPHLINYDQPQVAEGSFETSSDKLIAGTIFYPYYTNDETSIHFTFVESSELVNYQIDRTKLLDPKIILKSDTPAILGFDKVDANLVMQEIFLIENDQTKLIWQGKE